MKAKEKEKSTMVSQKTIITLTDLVVSAIGVSIISFALGKIVGQAFHKPSHQTQDIFNQYPSNLNLSAHDIQIGNFWVLSKNDHDITTESYIEEEDENDDEDEDDEDDDEDDDAEDNSAFHLKMTLTDIPRERIDSKDALFHIMEEIKNQFDLDLVAHGCHHISGDGSIIQCLGILDEGHISIYARPDQSTVLFDLLTFEEEMDIDNVDILSNIFGIKSEADKSSPLAVPMAGFRFAIDSDWSIRKRGRSDGVSDYDDYMETIGELKKNVISVQSKFQKIDIVDFLSHSTLVGLKDAMEKDPDYISNNPRLFSPDRTLFLDGVTQSTREGDAAYHESLVHPAMFAHSDPKRVAIIGGGECATLREVLKHNTVEKVTMIDIDEMIVAVSREFLPDWNDCSNLEGSSAVCMDDARAEVLHEDAFKWFTDRFGPNPVVEEPPFDVIILDALDPQNVVDFAEALYGDDSFMSSLYNGLTRDGILVSQVGQAVEMQDPAQTYSVNKNRALFIRTLTEQGFVNIAEYIEGNAMFEAPWTFNVVFKSLVSRRNWDDNEAMVNLKMRKRSVRTMDGKSSFHYFDGADMQRRLPTKASEVVFCRQEPTPEGCKENQGHGFDPFKGNIRKEDIVDGGNNTTSSMVALMSEFSSGGEDLSSGAYLMLEDAVESISVQSSTQTVLEQARGHHLMSTIPALIFVDEFQKKHFSKSSSLDGKLEISTVITTLLESITFPELNSFSEESSDGVHVYNPALDRNPSPHFEIKLSLENHDIEDQRHFEMIVDDMFHVSSVRAAT